MKADAHTPGGIFGNQIRYVIPLYQRPYVWTKDEQWEPLWSDVRTLAERVQHAPSGYGVPPVSPHFLGAIVIDQVPSAVTHIGTRHVIDGQQRLTSLQLLLDAAQVVVAELGRPMDAEALRGLVSNNSAIAIDPDHVFKVWPTDRDQEAFRSAMHDDLTPTGDAAKTRIAMAHAYFEAAIRDWATQDAEHAEERLAALTSALANYLRLVVIDLEPGDNAQVIFETLNHRGAPLLAADLIKNLVFQIAEAQGLDGRKLYENYWRELDGDYWRQMVAQGRLYRPRIDVFMHRWLVMSLQREVQVDRVFTEFRDSVALAPGADIEGILREISTDAAVHKSWSSLPVGSVAELFHYRVLNALDTKVMAPVFLWLTRFSAEQMPPEQQEKALGCIESWLVRRAMARVTTKDYNNVVIDMLKELVTAGPSVAGDTVETFLGSSSAESRFWPDNDRVSISLVTDPIYNSMTRARVRMLLEALEDASRTHLGEGQPAPRKLTIEHVMPKSWKSYWGSDVKGDPERARERDRLVHTLGNLSLVTGRLNPTLSNRPWTGIEAATYSLGNTGKRDYLLEHSDLKLNAQLVHQHPDRWTDDDIRNRTEKSLGTLLSVWPVSADATQPASTAPSPPSDASQVISLDDFEHAAWASGDEAVSAARTLVESLSPVAVRLLTLLSSVAPEKVDADVLSETLGLESGTRGVAGVLSGIAVKAEALGRSLPVHWQEGEPSAYWLDADTAATLDAVLPLNQG